MTAPRRPLDEMLAELVDGIGAFGSYGAQAFIATGIAPSSVEFDLPVETSVEQRDGRWVVLADSPRTRLRTDFDPPAGRLTATIALERPA
jgi:hypothetical protein